MKRAALVSGAAVLVGFLTGACDRPRPTAVGVDGLSPQFQASSIEGSYPLHRSALSFDGIDDYVTVPDDPSLDMADGFTIAAWIYIDEYTEWASIVTKGATWEGNNYTIHQGGPSYPGTHFPEYGHLRFTRSGLPAPLPESNTIIPLHEWHFVAVTFDGTTVSFYLDGRFDGQQEISGGLPQNNEPLNIGADFPGAPEFWNGMIDELRIWNTPLGTAHIQAAMNGHSSPLASALVGYWTFGEGSGTVAHDRSTYGNDGALVGDPAWVSQ